MKAAIIILSDPKAGSEEALGRVFNALAAAYDFSQKGDEVTVLFQGAGARWPGHLTQADHPAHGLYEAVKGTIAGVSEGCVQPYSVEPRKPRRRVSTSSARTPCPEPPGFQASRS